VNSHTCSAAYVYAIEVNGVVRYIGKGRGNRMYFHRLEAARTLRRIKKRAQRRLPRWHRMLVGALQDGAKIQEVMIKSGLSDSAAYELESRIIGEFHLLSTSQLWNTIDERFIEPQYLPPDWNDPENSIYKVRRPLEPRRGLASCRPRAISIGGRKPNKKGERKSRQRL
jgi:hypothetical protein